MMLSQFGRGPNGPIEYKILTDDKIEDALSVQQISMKRENVALGAGIYEEEGAAEAMKIVFGQVIKDNCTIIALDLKNNEVVGVAFNKLRIPTAADEVDPLVKVVENHLKHRSSLALVNFLDDRYRTDAAMEIFYIGTAPGYRGYKIGHGLVERSIRLAESLVDRPQRFPARTIPPGVIFGVFTSNYSQRIAAKLNFEWLTTVRYDEYNCNGVKMSERIGNVHHTAKLGALKLPS